MKLPLTLGVLFRLSVVGILLWGLAYGMYRLAILYPWFLLYAFFVYLVFNFIEKFIGAPLAFNKIVRYTGIDELELLKHTEIAEQIKLLDKKLVEKAQLLNYRLRHLLKKTHLKKIISQDLYIALNEQISKGEQKYRFYTVEIDPTFIDSLRRNSENLELAEEFENLSRKQQKFVYVTFTLMRRAFG